METSSGVKRGNCDACPLHSCSARGSTSFDDCKCLQGFYMSGGGCVLCPEGMTTATNGSTSVDDCSIPCGLPHSSTAGDNAQALVPAMGAMAAADIALTPPIGPYSKAVNDEKEADELKATAQTQLMTHQGLLAWHQKELAKAETAEANAAASLQTAQTQLNVATAAGDEAGISAATEAVEQNAGRVASANSAKAAVQADVDAAAVQVLAVSRMCGVRADGASETMTGTGTGTGAEIQTETKTETTCRARCTLCDGWRALKVKP